MGVLSSAVVEQAAVRIVLPEEFPVPFCLTIYTPLSSIDWMKGNIQ